MCLRKESCSIDIPHASSYPVAIATLEIGQPISWVFHTLVTHLDTLRICRMSRHKVHIRNLTHGPASLFRLRHSLPHVSRFARVEACFAATPPCTLAIHSVGTDGGMLTPSNEYRYDLLRFPMSLSWAI